MAKGPKFTEDQKYEIALELVSGSLSHSEICRKWDISPTYAYKLKDRAFDLLRQGIGPANWEARWRGRSSPEARIRSRAVGR